MSGSRSVHIWFISVNRNIARLVPSEKKAIAPVIDPVVVGDNITEFKVVRVDIVFRRRLAIVIDQVAVFDVIGVIPFVKGKGAGHAIHAGVATDATIQKDTAVATGTARYVPTHVIRGAGYVLEWLEVGTQLVHQRKPEHRPIGAVRPTMARVLRAGGR